MLVDLRTARSDERSLWRFMPDLRSVAPEKHIVIITSNEGFRECIDDATTADEFVHFLQFPLPTVPELTLALQDALMKRAEGSSMQAFSAVPQQITSELITEGVVRSVVEQLPRRHGLSMRVWGLLLSQPEARPQGAPPTAEALSENLNLALRSQVFLRAVAREVDLRVATLSKVNGLMQSAAMSKDEYEKVLPPLFPSLHSPRFRTELWC